METDERLEKEQSKTAGTEAMEKAAIGEKTINSEYHVTKLSEYFEIIQQIVSQSGREKNVLWFRGQESVDYTLLPSLYRDNKFYVSASGPLNYSSIHLRESMRLQHYHAMNYPFIKNDGLNSLEWLGLAQHHGLKTRLLDWSYSAIHSLIFAVEKHLTDMNKKPATDLTPCVWVLEPQELNKKIIKDYIKNDMFEKLLNSFCENTNGSDIYEMHNFLRDFKASYDKEQYKYVFLESQNEKDMHLNYLFNLAFFDELLIATKNNPAAVFRTTGNPIYLLLSKYYIEGFEGTSNEDIQLTPMAIIHPLHSERIRAQHGAFTIFPYPTKSEESDLSYMAMENLEQTKGILQKIIISDPYRIAEEMKKVGINESWLYPEAPFINNEIENG